MKALFELFRRFDARRIFGFIRRLGGMSRPKVECYDLRSTHALRVEGDSLQNAGRSRSNHNFYPRPPGGGRRCTSVAVVFNTRFLSTPSGWRATADALYARATMRFLSTPSGWRATGRSSRQPTKHLYFYPRPPGGGRHSCRYLSIIPSFAISIHALRVEGDAKTLPFSRDVAISIHALRVEGDI